jgi:hypothetical protein
LIALREASINRTESGSTVARIPEERQSLVTGAGIGTLARTVRRWSQAIALKHNMPRASD